MGKLKIGIFIAIISLLCGGIWYMIHPQYYYVKVTTDGEIRTEFTDDKVYYYDLKGYDEDGNGKNLHFSTHPDLGRPFIKDSYLKITYTNLKKERGYMGIKRTEIPQKALIQLEKKSEF